MDFYEKSRVNETSVNESFINLINGFVDQPIRAINQHVLDNYAEKMIKEATLFEKKSV